MITPFGELPNSLAVDMTMAEQHEYLRRRVARRPVVRSIAVGALAGLAPSLWRQAPRLTSAAGVGGRHVSPGRRVERDMVVEFMSHEPFANGVVEMRSEDHTARAEVTTARVTGSSRYYCRATFDGLRPDTSYRYTALLDGRATVSGTTRTGFEGAEPFRFTAYGDQGCGEAQQAVVRTVGSLNPRLNLMCGDLCYADNRGAGGPGQVFDAGKWDLWLEQNDPVTATVPFLTVPGNHEMEPGYAMHGYAGFLSRVNLGGASPLDLPTATSMRLGNVQFVGLDTNDVSFEIPANRGWTEGRQTRWLRQQLSMARNEGSGVDWIVAFMHASPFSTNSTHASEGGVLSQWVPLFDQFSVDLVISGHNHCYERTAPIRAGMAVHRSDAEFPSIDGTTYITAGGGGQGGQAPFITYAGKTRVATESGPEVVSQNGSTMHRAADASVVSVDVAPPTRTEPGYLRVRAVRSDGSTLDQFSLTRGDPKGFSDVIAAGALASGAAVGTAIVAREVRQRRAERVEDSGTREMASTATPPGETDSECGRN